MDPLHDPDFKTYSGSPGRRTIESAVDDFHYDRQLSPRKTDPYSGAEDRRFADGASRMPPSRKTDLYYPQEDYSGTASTGHSKSWKESIFGRSKESELKILNESLKSEMSRLKKDNDALSLERDCLKQDLRRSEDRLAELERDKKELRAREHEAHNDVRRLESKVQTLTREITSLKQLNSLSKKRVRDLEYDMEDAMTQQMYAEASRISEPPQAEPPEEITSQLQDEIREMESKQITLKTQNASQQDEIHRLQKQLEQLDTQRKGESQKTEEVRRREQEYAERVRRLEREVEEHRKANEKHAFDDQDWQRQREDLTRRNIELEERTNSLEKEVLQLKLQLSSLQGSSEAREKAMAESQQQQLVQLRQRHKTDLEEAEKRFAGEKEDLQSQLEMFLRSLNDDKRLERDTVRTAVQQMASTNMVTNQILNAAFRAYQERRYGPAASLHDIDDDV